MSLTSEFKDFAYCPMSKFDDLAALADPEPWGEDNRRIKSYVRFLYRRVAKLENALADTLEEGTYLAIDGDIACFDTGLFTQRFEPIYALFAKNSREGAQEWFLDGFFKASSPALAKIDALPSRVWFYDDPADLIYDYRYEIRVNYDHILGDENNLRRIPEALRAPQNDMMLRRVFEGAVAEVERRVKANYTLAVPQYYNDGIQLLLPLCLTGNTPELALTVQRKSGFYAARTCLTMEMAYNNARLIVRPEASWIAGYEAEGPAHAVAS